MEKQLSSPTADADAINQEEEEHLHALLHNEYEKELHFSEFGRQIC
jgi:hypothetical protein